MADDLMQMQRQAAHRVRQMQEHTRRVFESHQESPRLYQRPPLPVSPPPELTESPTFEEDQWLVLGLALLLFRSGCRTELLLALLYLAL